MRNLKSIENREERMKAYAERVERRKKKRQYPVNENKKREHSNAKPLFSYSDLRKLFYLE